MFKDEFAWADNDKDTVWESHRRFASIFGNNALRNGHQCPFQTQNASFFDKYERLAFQFFDDFNYSIKHLQRTESEFKDLINFLSKSSAIELGYLVCGRLIKQFVSAYLSFCLQEDREPNLKEFRALLLSKETYNNNVNTLPAHPSAVNAVYETAFGLRIIKYLDIRFKLFATCYEVFQNQQGELSIRPNDSKRRIAELKIKFCLDQSENKPRKCPATEVLIPKLWRAMATECLENPAFILADFKEYREYKESI